MYPSVPSVPRFCSKQGQLGLEGEIIPAGSYVFAPIKVMMHDPDVYHNPHVFDIDRKIEADRIYTFSIGSRKCPASFLFVRLVFKYIIVSLFKDFDLTLTSDSPSELETIPVFAKLSRMEQKYYGELTARNNTNSQESRSTL